MTEILVQRASGGDEFTRLTAITWVRKPRQGSGHPKGSCGLPPAYNTGICALVRKIDSFSLWKGLTCSEG